MITQTILQKKVESDYLKAFSILEEKIYAVLQTYSNVERGSGHHSLVTTALYEQAREIVLEYLHLDPQKYVVIFCSPLWSEKLKLTLKSTHYYYLTSHDLGLPIGISVLAILKSDLPKGIPARMGGGTIKLVSARSLVLADIPDRFEAGTPPVVNAIAFALALRIIGKFKANPFQVSDDLKLNSTPESVLHQDRWINSFEKELLNQLKQTVIGIDAHVPTSGGNTRFINLDNAASTPALEPVWETVCQTWRQTELSQKIIIAETKNICSKFFHAPSEKYDIIFCSNTTEAINIAAENLNYDDTYIEPVILNTRLEHHSNELPWRYTKKASLIRLDVDANGFINHYKLESLLKAYNQSYKHGKKRIKLVAVTGASNVLGTFNDIRSIAVLAHQYNAQILVDGAQLAAHRKVDMLKEDIDFFAFSGHKMYAPFGSGALIVRKNTLNLTFESLEKIKASGEENVVGIAALGKAMNLLQRIGMNIISDEEHMLSRYALQSLLKFDNVKVYGLTDVNHPQFANRGAIITFKVKGAPHNLVAKELAELGGIGVRTGCFCAHLIVKRLMGITPFRGKMAEASLKLSPTTDTSSLPGIVRISMGFQNNSNDIEHFIDTMKVITSNYRNLFERFLAFMESGSPSLPKTKTGEQINDFVTRCKDSIFKI